MKILRVEPEKSPEIVEMDSSLATLQKAVGGYIEAVYPWDDPIAIICNDDGKFNGMPLNRAIYRENGEIIDIIAGTFLIVGLGNDDFCSLSDELAQKYADLLRTPEVFLRSGDRLLVFPLAPCPF